MSSWGVIKNSVYSKGPPKWNLVTDSPQDELVVLEQVCLFLILAECFCVVQHTICDFDIPSMFRTWCRSISMLLVEKYPDWKTINKKRKGFIPSKKNDSR